MNTHLRPKIAIVALVATVAFLAAWQGSGLAWGIVSAIALGGGFAVAVFHVHPRRGASGRSTHDRKP